MTKTKTAIPKSVRLTAGYLADDGYVLREETVSYIPDYDIKNSEIGLKNDYE